MSNNSLIQINNADDFIRSLKTPRTDKKNQKVSEIITQDNKVNIVQKTSLNQFLQAYNEKNLNLCIDKTTLQSKLSPYLNDTLNGQLADIEKIKEIYNLCKNPLPPIVKPDKTKVVLSIAAPIAGIASITPDKSSKSPGELALEQYIMNYDTLINTNEKYKTIKRKRKTRR